MKNILVQYQGGGYSGCHWEWNYFFLDNNGVFCDIFSSGDDGIRTAEQAKELLEKCGPFYTYDMTDDKAIEEFSRECNVRNITSVLQWFENNPQDDIEFFVLCSDCGQRQTDVTELSLKPDKLLCFECSAIGTCDCCEEYIGESNIIALYQVEVDSELVQEHKFNLPAIRELIEDGFDAVCCYCLGYKVEKLDQANKDELVWASRTTGEPDMFSDEMSWFWALPNI